MIVKILKTPQSWIVSSNSLPKITWMWILILLPFMVQAELLTDPEAAAIEKKLPELKEKEKINALIELAQHYKFINAPKSRQYAYLGIEEAVQLSDLNAQVNFYAIIGGLNMVAANYPAAIDTLQFGLTIAESIRDTLLPEYYNLFGIIYQYLDRPAESIAHYKHAITLSYELGRDCQSFYPLGNLSDYFRQKKAFEKSRTYLEQALDRAIQCEDESMKAFAFKEMSFLYIQLSELDSATIFARKALDEAERANKPYITSDVLVNLSIIYREKGRLLTSINYANQAIGLAEKINAAKFLVRAKRSLAQTLLKRGKVSQALEEAKAAVGIVVNGNMKDEFIPSYEVLQFVYVHKNNYKKAFSIENIIDSLQVQAFNKSREQLISVEEAELQTKVENAVAERLLAETESHKFEMKKGIVFAVSTILFSALIASLIFFFYRQNASSSFKIQNETFETNEIQLKSKFINQVSLVGFVLLAFILIFLYFWGTNINFLIGVPILIQLGLTWWLSHHNYLKGSFITGLLYYPYLTFCALYFPIMNGLPMLIISVFIVLAYMAYRSWMHAINWLSFLGVITVYFLYESRMLPGVPPQTIIPGLITVTTLTALSLMFITITFFNKNILTFKNAFWKNHQFLQQISNINPHFVFAKDKDRRFTFVNKSISETYGFDLDYFIGKRNEEIEADYKNDDKYREDDKIVLQTGQTINDNNSKVVTKDGTVKWFDTIKKPILDEQNNIVGILGVSTDVSSRVAAEEALKSSKKQYQTLIEASPNSVVTLDLNGVIQYASPRTHELFGHPPQSMIGKPVFDFILPNDHEKLLENYKNLLNNKVDLVKETLSGVHANGQIMHVEGSSKLIKQDDTSEVQFLIIFNDISEKVLAQQELKERHLIYEALITGAFDAIDIVQVDRIDENGIVRGKVVIRNDMMAYYTRSKDQLCIQMQDIIHISPKYQIDGQLSEEAGQKYFEKFLVQNHAAFEWTLELESGELVTIDVIKRLIRVNHKSLIIRVARDITQERRQKRIIQQQVKDLKNQKQELERYIASNMELENFAYIASHDLRAPIRTITSFAQLLSRSIKDKLSVKESEYLSFIISSSQNMNALINDLLTYSRVNSTKINPETKDLHSLIEEVLADLKSSIEEKNAQIICQNIPNVITADHMKLRQLLLNLISNGIKFSKPDHQPVIEIGCKAKPTSWEFFIKDNGIGISKEYFDRIFLLFNRLHNIQDFEGTGIGLALCKKIVSQHQGQIWLESEVGQGTTFYFTISKMLEQPAEQLEESLLG